MEAIRFLKLLKKHRLTLIAVPLFVIVIAFILLRNLPDTYSSKATLSAGIVDHSQQLLTDKDLLADSKTQQAFSNLLQLLQMKKIFDQVSYKLILHDLTESRTFTKPSKLLSQLNMDARRHAVDVYLLMYKKRQELLSSDKDQHGLNDVIVSMKYDGGSISKKLKAYRVENSDFINIEYESESPELSAFVVNTLCDEFINYYGQLTKENELNTVLFLDTLLKQKKDSLDSKNFNLSKYKISNNILNLDEQTKSVYAQKAEFETQLQKQLEEIDADEGALRSLNERLSPRESGSIEPINKRLVRSQEYLNKLNEEYIRSNYDEDLKKSLDSMKVVVNNEVSQMDEKGAINPLSSKQSLITQKQGLEIKLDLAKNSLKTINEKIQELNKTSGALVPNEAVIESIQSDVDLANKDYEDILAKYNQANLEYNSIIKLKILEQASPGTKQASKKIILIGVSGIGSFVFCMLVLFILFYLDNSIVLPTELANKTNAPVLGYLPLLNNLSMLDLGQFWGNKAINDATTEYKNQLRSTRFEIDNIIHSPKLVNITSFQELEGKSLFAICLASAYLMISKRVLLIDGNFDHPSITEILKPEVYIEDYLSGNKRMPYPERENEFIVMGNKGYDVSLFELADEQTIKQRIRALKDEFDVIFIESSALNTLNRSKEWHVVVDHIIGVYEAEKTIASAEMQQLNYLNSQDHKFIGWVMNKVEQQVKEKVKKEKNAPVNHKFPGGLKDFLNKNAVVLAMFGRSRRPDKK